MSRILIVDENPSESDVIRRLLEAAGYAVEAATDALEALRAIRADAPDLVVTTLRLPGMDGVALVESIRHDFPFVPVVLVTSFGSEAIASRALRMGAASYVPMRDLPLDLVPTLAEILEVRLGNVSDRKTALGLMERAEARYVMESDPSLVAPLARYLEEELPALEFCHPADVIRVGLALHHALTHAIGKGNLEIGHQRGIGPGSSNKELAAVGQREIPHRGRRVEITAKLTQFRATYAIRGEHVGLDPSLFPDPDDHTNLSRSDIRGLLLVRTFMDEVVFDESGSEITLIKGTSLPSAQSEDPTSREAIPTQLILPGWTADRTAFRA